MIPNELISDPRFNPRDMGIYLYLKSKPSGWDFAAKRIAQDCGCGIRIIENSLKSLEEIGILSRSRRGDGKVNYVIYDYSPEKPICGKRRQLKPQTAKTADISKKDSLSNTDTKVKRREGEIERKKPSPPSFVHILSLFPVRTRIKDTERLIGEAIAQFGEQQLIEAITEYSEAVKHWPQDQKPKIKTSYYFMLDQTYRDDYSSYWKTPKPKNQVKKQKPAKIEEPEGWAERAKERFSAKGNEFWDSVEFMSPDVPEYVWQEILTN